MIEPILKWIFIQYNRRALTNKLFDGQLTIQGLEYPVIIHRDEASIPHIYAKTNNDLMFTQGWIHAQDRLWQMEMNRRVAMGRISEIFGDIGLGTDRLVRTLGFNRLAKEDWENTQPELKLLMKRYADGVNAYISKGKFPIEFKLAGVKPELWDPIDSIAWGRVMSWTLSHGWSGTLTRQEIIEKVGVEKATELAIYYPDDNPVELPNGLEFNTLSVDKMYEAVAGPFLGKDMEGGGRGSNAWAVSAEKSTTGRPILCNDTHLVLSTPGVWYLNHLHSEEGFHVIGASLPGVNGILLGHNEKVAWGITLAYTDVEDIFIEKVNVENVNTYEYCGENIEFDVVEETIRIKGKPSHIEIIKSTIHGPVIGDVLGRENLPISLCSKTLMDMDLPSAIYALNTAQGIQEFSNAVDIIFAPQLNVAYADIDGNIALFISGRVPIRKKGNGQLPIPGWTGEYDWDRDIPLSEMPKLVNPKQGYLISCNNKIVDDSYPFFLGNSYMNGFRARRIENIFSSNDKISIQLCQDLHQDFYSIPAEIFIKGMIGGLRTAKPKVQKILDVLLSWDFMLTTDSYAATVYEVLMYKIVRNLVEDDLGETLTNKYMGQGDHPVLLPTSELLGHTTQAVFNILQNSNSKWVASSKEILNLLEKSMISTCQWLEENMGYDIDDWKWGKIHHVQFRHGLSVKAPLDKILNVGPYPIGGDTDTVCQTAYNPSAPYHASEWCPSIRLIIDVGEWDNSLIISPPGQSGVLGSKHYSDMAEKWIMGEYIPLLWSRSRIEASAQKTFRLIPEV